MKRPPVLLAALAVAALGAAGALAATAPAFAANLLANPGFESGAPAPWSCTGGLGSVVGSPVHGGRFALNGAASTSDNAQCTPTVAVQPNTSFALSWTASTGTVTGYRVYEDTAVKATASTTSATVTGLTACTSHTFAVTAFNSAGESTKSPAASATTTGCVNTGLPKHALIGYLHASFANGSGYLRMADIPSA